MSIFDSLKQAFLISSLSPAAPAPIQPSDQNTPTNPSRLRVADIRLDGWTDTLSGIGKNGRDKLAGAHFEENRCLTREEIEDLDQFNGIAANILSLPAEDATRRWCRLQSSGEDLSAVEKAMRDIPVAGAGMERLRGFHHAVRKALRLTRKFGGAGIVVATDDNAGKNYVTPLTDRVKIKSIRHVSVFDASEMWPTKFNSDPLSENYGKPEIFRLQPLWSTKQTEVHASRVIVFDGVDLSWDRRFASAAYGGSYGWGGTELDRVYVALRNSGLLQDAGPRTILDTNVPVLKIRGLKDLMATDEGQALVSMRMRIAAMQKSVLRMFLLDSEGESFEYKAANLQGFDKLLQTSTLFVSAVSGIPVTRLYGRSPAGQNATGESDMRNYYDRVMSNVITPKVVPAIERMAELIMRSINGPTKGRVPEVWSVLPNPLYEMTENEQATLRKTQADIDEKYIRLGVITAEEVRNSRFRTEGDSNYTTLLDENSFSNVVNEEEEEQNADEEDDPIEDSESSAGDDFDDDDGNGRGEAQ